MKRRQNGSPQMIKCSFCARGQDEVAKLVAGPSSVYICSECIKLCNDILEGELLDEASLAPPKFPKPKEIREYLDTYVIGQEGAKVWAISVLPVPVLPNNRIFDLSISTPSLVFFWWIRL